MNNVPFWNSKWIITVNQNTNNTILTPWEKDDWSIVDMYWNVLSLNDRCDIIEKVSSLPVTWYLDQIANLVDNNKVIILDAETWSWKSTQISKIKMLLDKQNWKNSTLIATQPRVISAVSLADRVSKELLAETWNPHFSVWYDIWYRTWAWWVSSKHTSKISYHTDWLELMRQMVSWNYPDYLVLDEIHHFSIPTEFLAYNLVSLIKKNKIKTKLILMSATIDSSILQNYFSQVGWDIPALKIPWRTHPVTVYNNLWEDFVKTISSQVLKWSDVLYFVEWKKEIEFSISLLTKAVEELKSNNPDFKWALIYPLHAQLPVQDQMAVLKKQTDLPVVIVSTNVAEESITVDYIDTVVDTWKEKTVITNMYWIDELRVQNISQANAKQRYWRAWRTHAWTAIRINSKPFEDMEKYPIAPIEKEMLDRYILIALSTWIDILKKPKDLFIHSPDVNLLKVSYRRLRSIHAINSENKITNLWIELLKYPLSVYNSLILHSAIEKNCVDEIIYAVSIFEKNWFLSKAWAWKNIKLESKSKWDIFAYIELFKLLTSTKLPSWKLDLFKELWLPPEKIDEFVKLNWSKMFFEVVDLELIWIKNKRLKEILTLVDTLKVKLDINLSTKSDEIKPNYHDLIHCILSWNIHNVFKLIKKWKSTKFVPYTEKYPIDFKAWDVSFFWGDKWLTNIQNNQLFIGHPYIIWSKDETWEDTNILSNLVPIDEEYISEFNNNMIHEDSWKIFWHENPDYISKRMTTDDLENIWIENINDIDEELVNMQDKTKSKHFLAKNWLPYYLIHYNKNFIKYMESKWPNFDKYRFVELLKKVTVEESSRINDSDLWQTMEKFLWDTVVLETFIQSNDPAIVAFNENKPFVETNNNLTNIDRQEILENADWNTNIKEIIEAKKQFAKILWSITSIEELKNLPQDKQDKLNKIIHAFYVSPNNVNFLIWMKNLENYDRKTLQDLLHELRIINRKKKTLKKLNEANSKTNQLIIVLEKIIKMFENTNIDYIKAFFEEYKYIIWLENYNKFLLDLELIFDGDKRKLKRWLRHIKVTIESLSSKINVNKVYIKQLSNEISFDSYLDVKLLKDWLEEYFYSLFQERYCSAMIIPKINFLINDIIQLLIDWKTNYLTLLKDFINNYDFWFLLEWNEKFLRYDNLRDLNYELNTFKLEVFNWVKESNNINFLQTSIKKLTDFITRLNEVQKKPTI